MIRVAFGLALIARPEIAVGAAGAPLDHPTAVAARVLGARHLAQALLLRGERWRRAGAAVDGLHTASMLGLALVDERHRRVCLTNAGTAAALSLASLVSPR